MGPVPHLSILFAGDPHAENEKHTTDAYKSLFIARLSYDTSEKKLQREFEQYGPLKKVIVVEDKEGKPRGYAFLEFERESDMRSAYKQGDGKKVDGRRVLVDVERGRTVRNWNPRRLGENDHALSFVAIIIIHEQVVGWAGHARVETT